MDKKRPRKSRTPPARKREPAGLTPAAPELLIDLQRLIRSTRGQVAQAVNSALVLLYWQVGQRIRTDVLGNKRAEYGEEIVPTLSANLVAEFGPGYSVPNLSRMMRFAEVFPDRQILSTLSIELGS
ncbi:MAG: hypothetical protein KF873_09620 [Gemmataceae bacterium]|nr:hypothetical protein [Gemmataceae bacterium]